MNTQFTPSNNEGNDDLEGFLRKLGVDLNEEKLGELNRKEADLLEEHHTVGEEEECDCDFCTAVKDWKPVKAAIKLLEMIQNEEQEKSQEWVLTLHPARIHMMALLFNAAGEALQQAAALAMLRKVLKGWDEE